MRKERDDAKFRSEKYRIVTAKITRINKDSLIIDTPNGTKSIPRSLLHGVDDLDLRHLPFGRIEPVDHTFRLLEWKAEEVGLA